MAEFRTSLSRARGLGSAKHGAVHWVHERAGSAVLIPLVIWGVYSALMLSVASYQTAAAWLHMPLNAVLLSLLIVIGFLHMHSGLRVVIEDYLEAPLTRAGVLLANLFVCVLFGALAIFSVLKVALMGGIS
jgi:succinate dehydrogenase / fumarate reductase membrane anchor subunit